MIGGTGPVARPVVEDAPSNQRYRSFAERFVIERVRNCPMVTDATIHELTLQARTAYRMIKEVGKTLGPGE